MNAANFLFRNATYFVKKMQNDNKPVFLTFAVTENCNSKCRMCNFWKNNKTDELTLEEIKKYFSGDFWNELETVNLTGGEPTLRNDLGEIAKHFKQATKAKVGIATNGLRPDLVEDLLCNYKPYIDDINFSVDGINEDYALNRGLGKESFEKVAESINIVKDFGFKPVIGITVTKFNLHTFEKVFDYFKDTLKIVKVAQHSQQYYNDNLGLDCILGYDEEMELIEKIKKHNSGLFENGLKDYLLFKKRPQCYAGSFEMYVNSVGDVFPCFHKPSFGSLRNYCAKDIWQSKKADTFREQHSNCKECYERCTTSGYAVDGIYWKLKGLML